MKLRMGIIGLGLAFERLHYPAYQKLKEQFEIGAICDLDRNRVEHWREILGLSVADVYTDFREMIHRRDLNAFDIMVPIDLNFEITNEVAKVGKPIISEKPLAPTRAEAEAAKQLPQKYNIPIMIAENYRYNEENSILRDLVKTKAVGEVLYFIQNRVVDFPVDMLKDSFAAKEWRQHPSYPGGVFYDTGVHDTAALRHIFGPIDAVQAFGVETKETFSPYSVIQANLRFESGVIGHLSFFCAGIEMQRPLIGLRIFGTKGMIYLEENSCGTVNVAYNDGRSRQIPYQPNMGIYNELLNFYKAAAGIESLSVTPELEYGDAHTILSIIDSVRRDEMVPLN